MTMPRSFMRGLFELVKIIAAALFACGILLNFANVVGRYVFSAPIFWAEEVLVFLIIWCVMLGASVVAWEQDHLKVEILEVSLPKRALPVYRFIVALVFAAIAGIVAVEGFGLVSKLAAMNQRSVVAQIPMSVPYSAIVVGFSLMTVACLFRLYEAIFARSRPGRADRAG